MVQFIKGTANKKLQCLFCFEKLIKLIHNMNDNERGIIPRKIKGFRDINPELNQLRWKIITKASEVYKKYGYEHWDTPIIEYADSLGKYMPDNDTIEEGVYSFRNPEKEPIYKKNGEELRDKWNRVIMDNHHLSLRYDLTAPLARLYSENLWSQFLQNNLNEKKIPLFRRYQFGQVFRYETKLDPGRFREFWQLDFDTVGTSNVSADAEVCMILSDAMEAVGLKRKTYIVNVNNRKILKGFLKSLGIFELKLITGKELTEDDKEVDIILQGDDLEQTILRIIDKVDKIDIAGVVEELGEGRTDISGAKITGIKLPENIINEIVKYLSAFKDISTRAEILNKLNELSITDEMFNEGLNELVKIDNLLNDIGYENDRVAFLPTLVRGMAYYTGPVFEVNSLQTYIDEKGRERKVGAICGGGRYDGLVENLLGIKAPATGASIGVDRLAELLQLTKQSDILEDGPVFIAMFDDNLMSEYQKIAIELRNAGIKAEVYYGSQKGLKKQLTYADKKNCPVAILIGEDEIKQGIVTVKNLKLGKDKKMQEIKDKNEWRAKVQAQVKRENLVHHILEAIK